MESRRDIGEHLGSPKKHSIGVFEGGQLSSKVVFGERPVSAVGSTGRCNDRLFRYL